MNLRRALRKAFFILLGTALFIIGFLGLFSWAVVASYFYTAETCRFWMVVGGGVMAAGFLVLIVHEDIFY